MAQQINRTKLEGFLRRTNGLIFTAVFTKVDGTLRALNGRLKAQVNLAGGVNKTVKPSNGYITMFDMQKHAYRTLNLETVQQVRFAGDVWEVVA